MKKLRSLIVTFALAFVCLGATGCLAGATYDANDPGSYTADTNSFLGKLDGKLYNKEQVLIEEARTITNVVTVTNIVEVAASTNEAGVVTAAKTVQTVTPEIEVIQLPPVYKTTLVEKPGIKAGIDTASALPFPYAGMAGLAAGWLYSLYRSIRNKQLASALIVSVQKGREVLSTAEGERFKAKMLESQLIAGVAPTVKKMLDAAVPDHRVGYPRDPVAPPTPPPPATRTI